MWDDSFPLPTFIPTSQAVKHNVWNYWVFYISPSNFTRGFLGLRQWGQTGELSQPVWAISMQCYQSSLNYSCERDSDPPDVQAGWALATEHPYRMSDSSQKNPHTKRWFPRRTFSGSAPEDTKLAWCFWRALRRELTTSVSWTPRTLKCFVHARRTPWKVTVQWWPKSTKSLAHKPQSQSRLKCVEKSIITLSQNKSE